jgi:hypothetical protein
MTKTIWIDGYEANVPQRLGSGQVAFQLLKNLEHIKFKLLLLVLRELKLEIFLFKVILNQYKE